MLDGVGIRELLIGTVLDGRTVVDIADGRTNHPIVLVECRADEVVTAWAFARRLMSVTGRYPVIVTSWEPEFGAQFLGPLPSFPGIADGRLVDVLGERADFVTRSAAS